VLLVLLVLLLTASPQDVVFDVFSHEPNVIQDPTSGDFAMFFTAHTRKNGSSCNCRCAVSLWRCVCSACLGVLVWLPAAM